MALRHHATTPPRHHATHYGWDEYLTQGAAVARYRDAEDGWQSQRQGPKPSKPHVYRCLMS